MNYEVGKSGLAWSFFILHPFAFILSPLTLLKLSCPDRVGLLARLTLFVAFHGGNLLEVHQFTDSIPGWFFARLAIDTGTLALDTAALRKAFTPLAAELEADWSIREEKVRLRTAILVSRQGHCLADLLWRWRVGELPMEIAVVVSNHGDYREMVEREGLRFEHIAVDAGDKAGGLGRTAGCWRKRDRSGGAGALHADHPSRDVRGMAGAHHQYPPLVPTLLRGGESLSAGL